MKSEKIVNAIGHLDEQLIVEAMEEKKMKDPIPRRRWGGLAACFAVLLLAAGILAPRLFPSENSSPIIGGEAFPGSTAFPSTNTATVPQGSQAALPSVNGSNSVPSVSAPVAPATATSTQALPPATQGAIVPPVGSVAPPASSSGEAVYQIHYEYQVEQERYASYEGGRVIAEEKLGEKLMSVTVKGGWMDSLYHQWLTTETLRGEVYAISGVPAEVAVALRLLDQGEALTTTHYYVLLNPLADWSAVAEYVIAPMFPNASGEEVSGTVLRPA